MLTYLHTPRTQSIQYIVYPNVCPSTVVCINLAPQYISSNFSMSTMHCAIRPMPKQQDLISYDTITRASNRSLAEMTNCVPYLKSIGVNPGKLGGRDPPDFGQGGSWGVVGGSRGVVGGS